MTDLTIFLVMGNFTRTCLLILSSYCWWNCLVLSRLQWLSGTVAVLMMFSRGGRTLCREPISSYSCSQGMILLLHPSENASNARNLQIFDFDNYGPQPMLPSLCLHRILLKLCNNRLQNASLQYIACCRTHAVHNLSTTISCETKHCPDAIMVEGIPAQQHRLR